MRLGTVPRVGREGMVENWADVVADRMADASPRRKGRFLLLGAADTGKTTLMDALVKRLARGRPVALVDADVGQSHIGPPTTVGWTVVWERVEADDVFPYEARGIAFVGDVTPVGHLLQLVAALALCVEQAQQTADVIAIDTPGLVTGGAACALWWTVQRWLRPEQIIALEREDELGELLGGLQTDLSVIERIEAPSGVRRKSPEARQEHRRRLFDRYFQDATAHMLDLDGLAVRSTQRVTPENARGRIVGLTDAGGRDIAIGVIERWEPTKTKMAVRAPRFDIQRVRCLTIGDARIDPPCGWSG